MTLRSLWQALTRKPEAKPPPLPDVELVEGLHREAIENHNREVARSLYRAPLRIVGGKG